MTGLVRYVAGDDPVDRNAASARCFTIRPWSMVRVDIVFGLQRLHLKPDQSVKMVRRAQSAFRHIGALGGCFCLLGFWILRT